MARMAPVALVWVQEHHISKSGHFMCFSAQYIQGGTDGVFGMFRLSFILALYLTVILRPAAAQSDYYERLTLQPLPLGSLFASFDFRSNESLTAFESQDFRFFPRSLGQILQHASTKELHLRFSTGRWDVEEWGTRPWDGFKEGGTGVELWAWIEAESDAEAFEKWTILTQSLSGLFCASLNFIDSTRTTKPVLSFSPTGDHFNSQNSLHLLHGMLPGEVVCTENLTPFLKLLPCKGKAGISSLLDGHKIFDASWQSMSIDVRPVCPSANTLCHIEISQSIDMVLDIQRSKRPRDNPIPRPVPNEDLLCDESKPYHSPDICYPLDPTSTLSWSLTSVFGRPMAGSCPLTDDDGPDAKSICILAPHSQNIFITASGFEVKSLASHTTESRCYQLMPSEPFDMDVLPLPPEIQLPARPDAPLHLTRTLTGHGAASGGLLATLHNPSPYAPLSLIYFETLPWSMRPYLHTLRTEIIESEFPFTPPPTINQTFYHPALDRKRPTQLELHLNIPPASTVMLGYKFDKTVLRYTEYPPDANRGFPLPPAIIRILSPPPTSESHSSRTAYTGAAFRTGAGDAYMRSPLLLLALPTPDFSMPYNVIILTSTVMALAFGSVFNLLVRRFVAVEEVPERWIGKVVRMLRELVGRLKGKARGIEERYTDDSKKAK